MPTIVALRTFTIAALSAGQQPATAGVALARITDDAAEAVQENMTCEP